MKKDVDAHLQAALSGLSYARVRQNAFRAPWSSTTITHFLYLRWLHNFGSSERVEVSVGRRHHEAQAFADAMHRTFGGPLTRHLGKVGPTDSLIGFNLGKLCSWPLPFSLYLSDYGIEGCVRLITDDLEVKLRPLVCEIRDDPAMYAFLTQTEIKAMWPPNGAVRAAEAIFLGKRLGFPQGKVLSEIEPFRT